MPFVNIRIVKEVIASDPAGKQRSIAKAVKDVIRAETGLGDDDVWVVFEQVAARDWYIGEKDVEAIRSKNAGR